MPPSSSIARLQQFGVLTVAVTALGWLLWMWPRSPGWAVAGALAMGSGHAAFLALELLWLPRLARSDPAPPAGARERLRAWGAEVVLGLRVFAWRQPFRWRAVPDALDEPMGRGRQGVLLVHGFGCNRGFWTPWLERLRSQGRGFVAVNLEPPFADIEAYVPQIERAVQDLRRATGVVPLVIGHSMGGLAARAWLRSRSAADESAVHLVTIATPHGGTWMARFSRLPSGEQMRIGSAWLRELNAQTGPGAGHQLTCWWSNCDNVVMPPSSASLPGADNRLVQGLAHLELAFDPRVIDGTLALLDASGGSSMAPPATAVSGRA